jgi:hypothetical protein
VQGEEEVSHLQVTVTKEGLLQHREMALELKVEVLTSRGKARVVTAEETREVREDMATEVMAREVSEEVREAMVKEEEVMVRGVKEEVREATGKEVDMVNKVKAKKGMVVGEGLEDLEEGMVVKVKEGMAVGEAGTEDLEEGMVAEEEEEEEAVDMAEATKIGGMTRVAEIGEGQKTEAVGEVTWEAEGDMAEEATKTGGMAAEIEKGQTTEALEGATEEDGMTAEVQEGGWTTEEAVETGEGGEEAIGGRTTEVVVEEVEEVVEVEEGEEPTKRRVTPVSIFFPAFLWLPFFPSKT